jgi:hypothetical protein
LIDDVPPKRLVGIELNPGPIPTTTFNLEGLLRLPAWFNDANSTTLIGSYAEKFTKKLLTMLWIKVVELILLVMINKS